jgi:uncharacterized coiled-coil protein SlyX
MTDKTNDQLAAEIDALRTDLETKADRTALASYVTTSGVQPGVLASDKQNVLATQAWVQNETKSKLWEGIKSPEVLGFVTAFAIAKLEITPFINLDPAIENWFKKRNIERNRWGLLWKVKAAELNRRATELAKAEARLVSLETGIRRLRTLTLDTRRKHRGIERRVAGLENRSSTSRQAVRDIASNPALAAASSEVARLEARVNLLTVALS